MSVDTVKHEHKANLNNKDIVTWQSLIRDAESQISEAKTLIRKLQKSIRFFKKEAVAGTSFPSLGGSCAEGRVYVQKRITVQSRGGGEDSNELPAGKVARVHLAAKPCSHGRLDNSPLSL